MSGHTFENGLSVSAESSPRTPSESSGIYRSAPAWADAEAFEKEKELLTAYVKKIMQNRYVQEISPAMSGAEATEAGMALGDELTERNIEVYDGAAIEVQQASYEYVAEEESISPRLLFPSSHSNRHQDVARRLDFYSSGEWSPIPLPTSSSASASAAAAASVASWEDTMPIVVVRKPEEVTVGECSVCYLPLPKKSNHVFTACGHLFCVKCMLLWWDTSTTCAMCRAEILARDDDAASILAADDSEDDSADDSEDVVVYASEDAMADAVNAVVDAMAAAHYSDDDSIGGREVEPPRPIPAIDQYLHTDAGANWSSSLEGTTNPEHDDWGVQLSQHEIVNIRWGRETASMLWARRRFIETLFSDIEFLGETFHIFIQKRDWLGFSTADMGPHRMFEFVMCRTNVHNRGHESNFFGYISRLIVVEADHPVITISYDSFVEWENTNEYAFVVNVFSPTTAPYDVYNIDKNTYETTELVFRFADIRRMYSIQTCERVSA